MDVASFLQAAAASAFLAKLIVDGIKIATDLPRWAPVLFSFIAAQLAQFGLLTSQDASFSQATIASAAITGIVAWGLAMGITMGQTKADKVNETIDAALNAKPGTTREAVERSVKSNDN